MTEVRRTPNVWHFDLEPAYRKGREGWPESTRPEILKSLNTKRIGEGEGIGTKTPKRGV
jgi:hypothetical protein